MNLKEKGESGTGKFCTEKRMNRRQTGVAGKDHIQKAILPKIIRHSFLNERELSFEWSGLRLFE